MLFILQVSILSEQLKVTELETIVGRGLRSMSAVLLVSTFFSPVIPEEKIKKETSQTSAFEKRETK